MYIDFVLSDCQSLLIQWTHKTPSCAWLWDLPCLLARFQFVVSGPHVERWCLRIETQYDPRSGIHCRMCTSLPHSGETGVGKPSSSHVQSALLIFLVWALFWILVYLGLWESIVWLPKLFGSLSTLAAICAWLLLWLLGIVCVYIYIYI